MNIHSHQFRRIILAAAALLAIPTASFAQLNVIVSGGFRAAYQEILPEFEATTGITVTTTGGVSQGSGPNTVAAQLRRGVPADVVILGREGLDELIKDGKIMAGTDVDLAQTPIGLAVRAGAPRPDISTVEAFKQTLMNAKSVAYTSSTIGIYLTTTLFPKLGIADEMARKAAPTGIASVARGEKEIAIQPLVEMLNVQGTDFIGPIPGDIQYMSVFSAAVTSGSKDVAASKRLVSFLASAQASALIKKTGMELSKRP